MVCGWSANDCGGEGVSHDGPEDESSQSHSSGIHRLIRTRHTAGTTDGSLIRIFIKGNLYYLVHSNDGENATFVLLIFLFDICHGVLATFPVNSFTVSR